MIAIINASPLIFLGKIDYLKHLNNIFSKILTTKEVIIETVDQHSLEYPNIQYALSNWIEVVDSRNGELSHILSNQNNLDLGEITVIDMAFSLKKETEGSIVIIDDLAARKIAKLLGLQVTGTLGIILKLVSGNHISKEEGRQAFENLILNHEFRISTALYIKLQNILASLK
ncbi:MAG: DUF3368 domain-containing protein [Candidatus Heimdallarchaeota archaeon]|nr:DUF3368 domain-containing protein [Candidatus Heimdallarchaeota archaeon]